MSAAVIQKWILALALALGLAGLVAQVSPAQTTLVSTGSVWKYLDNGSDQASAWQGLLFNDISFDVALGGNFAEAPPSIILTSPSNETSLLTANATLTAEA